MNWEWLGTLLHWKTHLPLEVWEKIPWDISYFKEKYKWKICIPLELDLHHPFLVELKAFFDSYVVWQEEAKEYLSQTVLDCIQNLWNNKWPLWVLFFHGPTWVWKTEIVKALANAMFWDPEWFIKIDCEHLMESHKASTLFWAPPWYLWFDKTPRLTNKSVTQAYDVAKIMKKLNPMIQTMPWFNIVLFEEIEKAHPDIIQQLLSLIDEWKVTTSNGEIVNFQNSIIIFTSNIWQRDITQLKDKKTMWFSDTTVDKKDIEKILKRALKDKFSPEFIWRLHNMVEFDELTVWNSKKILEIQVNNLNIYLSKYFPESYIQFELSPTVYEAIIKKGFSKEKWARELVRTFNTGVKRYINRVLHSDGFEKYFDYEWMVLLWIDMNNKEELTYDIILSGKKSSFKEAKILEYGEDYSSITLEKINQIYATMSAYVELKYVNLDGDIDLKDELKNYADKLKDFWLSQMDISSLKNRAYIEKLREYMFIKDFEWLKNADEDVKDLFYPYETRTVLKIVERKFEHLYRFEQYNNKRFVYEWTKNIIDVFTRIMKVDELSAKQVSQLLFYIRKILVEKYSILTEY